MFVHLFVALSQPNRSTLRLQIMVVSTSASGQDFKLPYVGLEGRFEDTTGGYKVYIGMWGQAVLPPARGQKVTTMRPITPKIFNVEHVPKQPPGKCSPSSQCQVTPSSPT